MREIEFRGKSLVSKTWTYGRLRHCFNNGAVICPGEHFDYTGWEDLDEMDVDRETVGQCTGLKDKKGVKIFEGDIVEICDEIALSRNVPQYKYTVTFNEGCFVLKGNEEKEYSCDGLCIGAASIDCEVIGNIYDNPELLKGITE